MRKMPLHTCPPPKAALTKWLTDYGTVNGSYGHLLLEQKLESNQGIVKSLRPYFESAHADARAYFHEAIGLELHPDAEDEGAHAQYPQCLPLKARRGISGECLAGLVTESYELVGEYTWTVPVFLFRYHADVEAYMFALARNAERKREVFGRFGSDFIGVSLADDGSVLRFIAGEAKWREVLRRSVVDNLLLGKKIDDPSGSGKKIHSGEGIWYEVNRDSPVPHGVRQLQRLLEELAPEDYAAAIVSMDEALVLNNPVSIPRTNLILIVGNAAPTREEKTALIGWEKAPSEYKSRNDLQIVEIYLSKGEAVIDDLYDSLWIGEVEDASA
jgi:hypothetical protein